MPSVVKISRLNSSRKLGPRHGPARSPNNSSRSYASTHEIGIDFSHTKKTQKLEKKNEKGEEIMQHKEYTCTSVRTGKSVVTVIKFAGLVNVRSGLTV